MKKPSFDLIILACYGAMGIVGCGRLLSVKTIQARNTTDDINSNSDNALADTKSTAAEKGETAGVGNSDASTPDKALADGTAAKPANGVVINKLGPPSVEADSAVVTSTPAAPAPVAKASFVALTAVAVDNKNGDIYAAAPATCSIEKISAAGVVSTFIARALNETDCRNQRTQHELFSVYQMAIDSSTGTLYVADGYYIRKLTKDGQAVSIIRCLQTHCGGVALDQKTGTLYFGSGNSISKMTSDGQISLIAGSTGVAGYADGQGAAALFNVTVYLALDDTGNIFVNDYILLGQGNIQRVLRKITPAGAVTTSPRDGTFFTFDSTHTHLVGLCGGTTPCTIVPAAANTSAALSLGITAKFDALATDQKGNLIGIHNNNCLMNFFDPDAYVDCRSGSIIQKVSPAGVVTDIAVSTGVR